MDYSIRAITRDELAIPLSWAADEGWNPGLSDAESFMTIDRNGFYMGFLDNEPIASLSAVSYGPEFGFLGLYIVKPAYRGKGYGWKLWQKAITHLPTQNIGLDGVVAQQENYKKSGFRFAYRNIRYEGMGIKEKIADPQIVSLLDVPPALLNAYDQSVFLIPRPAFLASWIQQPGGMAIGYLTGSSLTGYGVIRPCKTGYKIGPLFADSHLVANLLFRKLLTFAGLGSPVFFDVPEPNAQAGELARTHGMKPMFETARMYTKDPPKTPLDRVFGITTFEVG